MFYATSTGYTAPAGALVNIQSALQTVLDLMFLGQEPNLFEVCGLILGTFGALSITMGPIITKFMRKKQETHDIYQSIN